MIFQIMLEVRKWSCLQETQTLLFKEIFVKHLTKIKCHFKKGQCTANVQMHNKAYTLMLLHNKLTLNTVKTNFVRFQTTVNKELFVNYSFGDESHKNSKVTSVNFL